MSWKTDLFLAWTANIGREPREGEATEFGHKFAKAKPDVLRRAIDEYFAGRGADPKGPATLGQLGACYARLDGGKRGNEDAQDEQRARVLVYGGALQRYGFAYYGQDKGANAIHVRRAFLDWHTRWMERCLEAHETYRATKRREFEHTLSLLGWLLEGQYEPTHAAKERRYAEDAA